MLLQSRRYSEAFFDCAKRNLSISKSIAASIAESRLCKIELFHFFPIELSECDFFQWIGNGRHNRRSSRVFSCHTLCAVTRVSGGIIARILCVFIAGWRRRVALLLWCRRWAPCFAPITCRAHVPFRKTPLVFQTIPYSRNVCVFFSFVLSEPERERVREPSCLRVFQFYYFIARRVFTQFYIFRYARPPPSSPALTLRLAFIFHPHIAWRRLIFASFAQVAAVSCTCRKLLEWKWVRCLSMRFFRCHGWCCCHFIIL